MPGGGRAAGPAPAWPLWEAYARAFIQDDGRVIDDQHETRYTTSEGQAYSLFFALVAGDRARFETLLAWTERHLAQGDLTARLPGWRWGRREDGAWALVDANAASDADLWLAHGLIEAARLWGEPRWHAKGVALLQRVQAESVRWTPAGAPILLPGPRGFERADGIWRINPSYLVLHQLRAFALQQPAGPWSRLAQSLPAMLQALAPRGFAPDWAELDPRRGWRPRAAGQAQAWGSYDAIRVYLWAGLVDKADPLRGPLLAALHGMVRHLTCGRAGCVAPVPPPRRVDTVTGRVEGEGPVGFSAAVLPYLHALGRNALVEGQRARVRAHADASRPALGAAAGAGEGRPVVRGLIGPNPTYYDQVLALFGLGALEGRYRFDAQGRLHVAWATRQSALENAAPT